MPELRIIDEDAVREKIFDEHGKFKEMWRKLVRERMEERAVTRAKPWTRENVVSFIYNCRVRDNGIPVFKTHYGGQPFVIDSSHYVLAVCWFGKNTPYGRSQWFSNVPKDLVDRMAKEKGDWRWLCDKYCTTEQKEEIYGAPVIATYRIMPR